MKKIFIILLSLISMNIGFSENIKIREENEIILKIIKNNENTFTYIDDNIFNIKKGFKYATVCELLIQELAIRYYPQAGRYSEEIVIGQDKICFIHDNKLVFITGLQFTFDLETELLVRISYEEIEFLDSTIVDLKEIKQKHQELAKKRALKEDHPNPWYGDSRHEYYMYQTATHSFLPHQSTKNGIIWTLQGDNSSPLIKTEKIDSTPATRRIEKKQKKN